MLQQMIGQFHPIFLHFPIVLFVAALVTDILNYYGRSRAFSVGHWLIISGVIMCIPTIITGLAAAEAFDATDPFLEKHRYLGFATGIWGSLYAGLRISAMRWELPLAPKHYLGLSALLVALVWWTSDYGGLVTRGVTPFNSTEPFHLEEKTKEHAEIIPKQLEKQFFRQISVNDVRVIFGDYHCHECHAKQFAGDKPRNFFEGKHPFLERNGDGSLKDFKESNFYRVVVVENRMPKESEGQSQGLTIGERLILLAWLENGAPME